MEPIGRRTSSLSDFSSTSRTPSNAFLAKTGREISVESDEEHDLKQFLVRSPISGRDSKEPQASDAINIKEVLKLMTKVTTPYFSRKNPHITRTWCMLIGVIALNILENLLLLKFSYVQRDYQTALQQKDETAFYRGIRDILLVIVVFVPLVAASQYLDGYFRLYWRQFLTTTLLKRYFSQDAFFHLKNYENVDNPDQRITQDVDAFTSNVCFLFTSFIDSVISLVGFSGVLLSISANLTVSILAYAAIGTIVSVHYFGRRLMFIQKQILAQEADIRFSLVRAREHAESIAFYRGANVEYLHAKEFFRILLHTLKTSLKYHVQLGLFSKVFKYLTFVVPPLIVAPAYFRGEVEFGVISQTTLAFHQILGSLTIILNRIHDISSLAAEASRIHSLQEALDGPHKSYEIRSEMDPQNVIKAENLTIKTPKGVILFENLSFTSHNEKLLIVGKTGCGKSSFLRVLAGLWDKGDGTVRRPKNCMFVPQVPYIPYYCTLHEAISYPSADLYPEDTCLEVLQRVNLLDLKDLEMRRDWSTLSIGEQQRLQFARVILNDPPMAFFDESTSAVDMHTEMLLYKNLKTPCMVSIGHRPSLFKYHTHVLSFDKGTWTHMPVTEHNVRRVSLMSSDSGEMSP